MSLPSISFSNDSHGWAELLHPRKPREACVGKIRSHWAVIGAGFTGLACARRLAELHPENEIILLDARAVGQAASGRNSGYAVACSHFSGKFDAAQKHQYQRINRINSAGLKLLREQVTALNIDCQWHEQGFYHSAADQRALREVEHFADYLKRLDIHHTLMQTEELKHQLGTGWYQRAIHVHEGALLQPAALTYGLADSLPQNVTLYEHSPVLALTSGSTHLLRTRTAEIQADQVLVCANFEATRLGLISGRILGSTLSGSFTCQLTRGELDTLGQQQQWGVLSLHSGGATVRLTEDGRISIRNTAEYHAGKLLSEKSLIKRQRIHRQAFENRFPQLRHIPFEYSWSGVEGISRNATNFFTNLKPGLYIAGGYNGSGVSRGTAFGHALAEWASGGQSSLITDCLDSPAAQWLPPRPLLDIGAWFTVRNRFRGVGRDR